MIIKISNVPDFPCNMCVECHSFLKKINSFRNRCMKIENFLSRNKVKLTVHLQHAVEVEPQIQSQPLPADADPLQIENTQLNLKPASSLDGNCVKAEPSDKTLEKNDGIEQREQKYKLTDWDFNNQVDADSYLQRHDDADMSAMAADLPTSSEETTSDTQPITTPENVSENQSKQRSKRYTIRLGKRLVQVKMTNEKKRIVCRQWPVSQPCICEHCGRQFKDVSNLNIHLLRHTGTKNFECEQCHQKCYTLHLLRRHQLKHTEGPYPCTFCGVEYSTNSSRVRHEREACKKGRGPQSRYDVIKRGERTFHCDVCDLWFLRAGNLTQHKNSVNHRENERRQQRKVRSKIKK
ncbi:zinc finger protein 675 isoform X2 [Scaptodrosophila lebanonensis]|uniref:Zinc finger protein 675 isoform X2 n=1 Tax=Drosophila lebanonensis TaxID=7225 RepID=A0A6J2TFB0_DROLE|nr:zinc finger protein 675 isoform X2 [Scaptodrosophila lebanonensis]